MVLLEKLQTMTPDGSTSNGTRNRRTLGVLAIVAGALSLLLVLPYLSYVLTAVLLAYLLAPFQRRLAPALGRSGAAGTLVLLSVVTVLVPIVLLFAVAIRQGIALVNAFVEGEFGVTALETRLRDAGIAIEPGSIDPDAIGNALAEAVDGSSAVGLRGVTGEAVQFVGGLVELFVGGTILVFVLFSLLKDGDRFVEWMRALVPLDDHVVDELFDRVDRIMWASIVGNGVVAAVQAVLTAIALYIVDSPGVVLLGLLTFVLALLPIAGAFFVWGPVAVYLVATGRPVAGAALFVYGTIVVGLSDNYLRPITVGRGSNLDVGTVVLGIFGGIAALGFVGLFVGPVILGAFKVLLELYVRDGIGSSPSESAAG